MQGLGKFGFYEVFKNVYAGLIGEENAFLWRTTLFLAASASAEFFADMMLAPMEAVKVRVQTQTDVKAPSTLRAVAPSMWRAEGIMGFYKGLPPLWMRQIPYTMMKFACFERTVEALYKYAVPKPRADCSKAEQLAVTFVAGYIAGVFCAIVSHPADSVVSKLNQNPGSGAVAILKELGPAGVWRGLGARIIMIGTLTALQWFIYDSVKVALRLPRPPPPEVPFPPSLSSPPFSPHSPHPSSSSDARQPQGQAGGQVRLASLLPSLLRPPLPSAASRVGELSSHWTHRGP